jgi:hypothetical protein
VRRLFIMMLCLCGFGLLLLLLARPRPRRPLAAPTAVAEPAAAPPAGEPGAASPVTTAAAPPPDPAAEEARTLQLMAELRASIIDGVSRHPLYLMAAERGAHQDMFVASSWDLLDAILRAEGLSPELRDASPEAVERLRALADEAFAREQDERRQSLQHYEVYRRFWRSSSA